MSPSAPERNCFSSHHERDANLLAIRAVIATMPALGEVSRRLTDPAPSLSLGSFDHHFNMHPLGRRG